MSHNLFAPTPTASSFYSGTLDLVYFCFSSNLPFPRRYAAVLSVMFQFHIRVLQRCILLSASLGT